ncbi:MAG: TldD/PmbA family protein [Candidatus Thorarchaeota archaeon]|nr:TldD/PmbA family protein [Candidatus Thorarchaeota archaeon]MCK5237961.1 TldD/PmbA family protein [Candidatus Thorarchaeota archaeon]
MDLVDTAHKLVSQSEQNGASQAEAFVIRVATSSIYIDDNIPKIGDSKIEVGVGLKFILGKKVGFTSSTLLSESTKDVVKRAMSIATISNEDPKFTSLPEARKVSGKPDRFYDKATAEADSSVLADKCMELVKTAGSDAVSVPNGVLRASALEFNVVNSLGVDASSKSTIVFGYFTAKADEDGKVGEGVQRVWSRSLYDVDFVAKGEKLRTQATSVINAKPFKEKWDKIVAVLAPSEGSEMMGTLVGTAVSAENVNNRSSPWTDKVGDTIAHENLSVIDNGKSKLGLMSARVDDEGVPTQKTRIIENGVLKSYLFDSYNANQLDLKSTGNGLRRGGRDAHGAFAGMVSCRPTTLEIPAGSKSVEEIISEVKKGVYIEHFAWPQVDPLSGTFSNEIRNAKTIENGELKDQIKFALLIGNLYESIKEEILIGSDIEVHGTRVMPTMAIVGTELVGQ